MFSCFTRGYSQAGSNHLEKVNFETGQQSIRQLLTAISLFKSLPAVEGWGHTGKAGRAGSVPAAQTHPTILTTTATCCSTYRGADGCLPRGTGLQHLQGVASLHVVNAGSRAIPLFSGCLLVWAGPKTGRKQLRQSVKMCSHLCTETWAYSYSFYTYRHQEAIYTSSECKHYRIVESVWWWAQVQPFAASVRLVLNHVSSQHISAPFRNC